MSQFAVPWRDKGPLPLNTVGRLTVRIAILVYTLARPVLSRFAGFILLSAMFASVLLAWAVYGLFGYVENAVRDAPGTVADFQAALERSSVPLASVLAYPLWTLQYPIVRDVIALCGVFAIILLIPMFAIWWERKVAGRIQSRCGPMRVGGWHGWAQSMADGLKLVCKEDLVPSDADRALFLVAPYLAFVPAVLAFVALPFGTYWVFRNLDVGLVFVLAMLEVEVVGVIVAGWASNSKWSLYGAMREACQMVSYEIPMGLALLIPIMCVGSLSLTVAGDAQSGGWHTWLAFRNPFTFVAFVTYYIAALASCKRAPFDLPESESELVAGFHTEYSGWRWCLFFFAEYAAMFVVCGLATAMFLGAWHSPLPASWAPKSDAIWAGAIRGAMFGGPVWFIAKCLFLLYVQLWLRWTLPRIRIDQVLHACIHTLLPLTMLLLLGNTVWEVLVGPGDVLFVVVNVLMSIVGAVFVLGFVAIAAYGWWNRRRLVQPRGWKYAVDLLKGS